MKTSRLAETANSGGFSPRRTAATGFPTGENLPHPLGALWRFLLAAFAFCVIALAATALAATVSWDRNSEPDIAFYQVRYGTSSGVYSQTVDAGNNTAVDVDNLQEGLTYYFVVVAVNQAGTPSNPSVEVSYQVPVTTPPAATLVSQASWVLKTVDSQEAPNYAATKAFDGNPNTFWHTAWTTGVTPPPHEIQIDLGEVEAIKGFRYLPRQDSLSVGNIADFEFYTSLDGTNWGTPAASGVFDASKTEKEVLFANRNARHVMLRCVSEAGGGSDCNVAELNLLQGEAITTPANQAPVASSKSVATPEDSAVSFTISATDPDGDSLTYTLASTPSKGTLTGTPPNLTYTPNADFNGGDSFTYQASDGSLSSNTATVSITVSAVNDVPVSASKSIATSEDTAVPFALSATDKDGDTLTYTIVSGPARGTLTGTAPNLTYTPNADANGNDMFTYKAGDGTSYSNTATVSITVSAVNDAPVAAAKSITTTGGTAAAVVLSATDKDGDTLTYSIVSGPSKGSLTGTAPNLTYTPNAGYSGADSFTYRASDGSVNSNTATVSITVTPKTSGTVLSTSGWRVLHVDSEETPTYSATRSFDGNPNTFWHTRFTTGATPPPHELAIDLGGTARITGFRYLPRQDSILIGNIGGYEFHTSLDGTHWGTPAASGSFANDSTEKEVTFAARNARYIRLTEISEAGGSYHSNVAELSVLGASATNHPPVATARVLETTVESPVSLTLEGTDSDDDPLYYSIASGPAHGSLSGTPPSVTYTPASGFLGTDSFIYQINDGAETATATVTVNVTTTEVVVANHAPVFQSASIRAESAREGRAYKGGSIAGFASDTDRGDYLRFSKTSGPSWLTLSPAGNLGGSPPRGSQGTHRFTVRATDKAGAFAEASLLIEIDSVSIPLPWEFETLGNSGNQADADQQSGALKLTGAGNLNGKSDATTFVWRTLAGDGQITARVSAIRNAGNATRAGVMIRSSLAPNSKHVFLGVNGNGDFRWVRRTKTGKPAATKPSGDGSKTKGWLRLVRKGDTIIAYKSADGRKWTRVGAVSADFGKHCHIGLAVSSGNGKDATATFRNIAVRP